MNLFNQCVIEQVHSPKTGTRIAAVDCTFVRKSGRHTEGLDSFYNGSLGKAQRGLEWSVVAVIDVDQGTGYALSAQQTQAGLSVKAQAKKAKLPSDLEKQNETDTKTPPEVVAVSKPQELTRTNRMDFYLGHLAECQSYLPKDIRYVAADAFYSKFKWVNRFEFVQDIDKHTKLYTAVVYSVSLRCNIRLAYLLKEKDHKRSYVLIFSTDLKIVPYDLRTVLLQQHASQEPIRFSIASYKRRALNNHLLKRFIAKFALDPTLIKSNPAYDDMCAYGLITP